MPTAATPNRATLAADRRDAYLFNIYATAHWNRRGWLMILSGLAGFNRNVGA